MTRIKICGVTTADQARAVADAGADAVGLNFYAKSPRFIAPQAATEIVRALPPFTATVGVFVNEPPNRATALAFQLGLRGIQTVDDSPHHHDLFPFASIVTVRVSTREQIQQAHAWAITHMPTAILVDAHVPGQMGGTGQTAPWHLLKEFDWPVPLILAGGLTPENVAEAIHVVRPWGVDVASGVESSPGVKDLAKVRAFVAAVHAIDPP